MAEIQERVYHLRPKMTAWTIDPDAKALEVFGAQKGGPARNSMIPPLFRWIWLMIFVLLGRLPILHIT